MTYRPYFNHLLIYQFSDLRQVLKAINATFQSMGVFSTSGAADTSMGLMQDFWLLIKATLTVCLIGLLYVMGPCGWMIGGVGVLFLAMRGH
jgi:hypothetical protein